MSSGKSGIFRRQNLPAKNQRETRISRIAVNGIGIGGNSRDSCLSSSGFRPSGFGIHLDGDMPHEVAEAETPMPPAGFQNYTWQSHCNGHFRLPIAAGSGFRHAQGEFFSASEGLWGFHYPQHSVRRARSIPHPRTVRRWFGGNGRPENWCRV